MSRPRLGKEKQGSWLCTACFAETPWPRSAKEHELYCQRCQENGNAEFHMRMTDRWRKEKV